MSFVFEWDKLDDEVALQIEGMIHAHFQRIPKPAFMGNIAVSKFRFGATPPSITVLDVTDPLEEWYVHMDQEEARLAQEAAEAGGGESMDEDELASGGDEDDDYGEYSFSADGSIVMVGEGDDIEYLQSGPFEEDERRETEEWLSSRLRVRDGSSSSGVSHPQRRHSHGGESGSDQDPTHQERHNFKSAVASPTRVSRSSSNASSSSTDSLRYRNESGYEPSHNDPRTSTMPGNRNNRNLKLDTSTLSASPRVFSSPADIASSTVGRASGDGRASLSSHASDEEIESEAFYTQGESTIYQRMRNLVLEPSSLISPRRSIDGGESPNSIHDDLPHHQQTCQNTLFSTTPSVTSPVGNSGGLGLGFGSSAGSGLGTSPGAVLSSVMQNRTNRPLSAAFYSTPVVNPSPSTTTGSTAPGPQLYFPDLSGMVVSGNSLLGLGRKPLGSSVYSPRAGTPSRTLPGTPRGFESPTLAFSRRQSFSEGTEPSQSNELHQNLSPTTFPDNQGSHLTEMNRHHHNHYHQNHNMSAFTSPVEALSFDAFSQSRPMDMQASTRADTNSVHTRTSDERLHGGGSRGGGGERGARRGERALADKQRRKKERHLQHQHQHKGHHHHHHHHKHHREAPPPPVPSKRHENDIQLLLSVQYQGQMGFTVETELLLNYPTFAFLALPVKLVITGFSFKEPEDPNERYPAGGM
ncbi:Mitochondrial distribution and morphology protein 12 [Podila clonocystis]|nr:Mitochondrial distribution and morphology protein 12 [Podila clonocystis]